MSKIEVSLKDNTLKMEKKTSRNDKNNIEEIPLNLLKDGQEFISNIRPSRKEEKNKIFLIQEIAEGKKQTILVYSRKGEIRYSLNKDKESAYKKIVIIKNKVINAQLTRKQLKLIIVAYMINPFHIKLDHLRIYADGELYKECKLKQYSDDISKLKILKDRNIYLFKFKMKDILKDESVINGKVRFEFKIGNDIVNYYICKKNKNIKEKKYYYVPIKGLYIKDIAIHIRRSISGSLILVKRKKEEIEKTIKFRIMESKFVSSILYTLGLLGTKLRKKKINLFYEKFASKAEEGVYELCKLCQQSNKTKNYFVIDKESKYYAKIKDDKNVIIKFSLKFYWIFYNTSYFIASEVPSHLNVLRSNNKYFRKAAYNKKLIFLQHGIIYMKNLAKNSAFVKGKEGESQYMIVSSQKEKDIVADMLKYDENQLLVTGIAMYSRIKYNHIDEKADDVVTIMLTWKPYEEQLYNFEKSSYYKNVVKIYNMLSKYIDKDKIIIIGHPKANSLLASTDIRESLWDKEISEALSKTKLLITDYSSICYNAFYQGAAVVFYQEDIEKYEKENGNLIPNSDEYVGKRAFNIEELEEIMKDSINNKKIILNKLRTEEHEKNYKTINEFYDGQNTERIYQKLLELNIV